MNPDKSQTPELLPCPFCGTEEIHEENTEGQHSVGCRNQQCFGYQSLTTFARRGDAIKAWNTRPNDIIQDLETEVRERDALKQSLADALARGAENCLEWQDWERWIKE